MDVKIESWVTEDGKVYLRKRDVVATCKQINQASNQSMESLVDAGVTIAMVLTGVHGEKDTLPREIEYEDDREGDGIGCQGEH